MHSLLIHLHVVILCVCLTISIAGFVSPNYMYMYMYEVTATVLFSLTRVFVYGTSKRVNVSGPYQLIQTLCLLYILIEMVR